MGDKERLGVGALVTTLALLVPGFVLHTAPRFAGSVVGSLLGIAAAVGMLLLLSYSLAKHIPWLRRRIGLGPLLSFHVYTGAVGAILGVLHTGHKFDSPLGIALVSSMLVVVLSGFVGRYYLVHIGGDVRDQQRELATLRAQYDLVASRPGAAPQGGTASPSAALQDIPVQALVAAIADLEFAIGRRETLKRTFSRWVVLHIAAALVLYPLLALHVWSGIYYGLRWLK